MPLGPEWLEELMVGTPESEVVKSEGSVVLQFCASPSASPAVTGCVHARHHTTHTRENLASPTVCVCDQEKARRTCL